MKNNLFNYATSELSQDAFICWLCSYAFDSADDPAVQKCAKQLLILFVPELADTEFTLLDVERQVGKVDVLLTLLVNGTYYKVIVEDKTFTSQHDNQLENYLQQVKAAYPDYIVKGVYYKTGFQSDLSPVIKAGYTIVSRQQMLKLMAPYITQTTNRIFPDYFEYWDKFQQDAEAFRALPVSQWNQIQANGFCDFLQTSSFFEKRNQFVGHGYVPNKSGGFYGLWFGLDDCLIYINGIPFELYLQLEIVTGDPTTAQLRLKLCAKENDLKTPILSECRDKVVYDADWKYALGKFNFSKPKRLAPGRHMTIGFYNYETADWNSLLDSFDVAIQDYQALFTTMK